MKVTCPHCSASLGIDEQTQRLLKTMDTFDCPVCAQPIPSPVKTPPARSSAVLRSVNRNVRILGAAAILLLGGVVAFLATRKQGSKTEVIRKIDEKTIHNEFFTRLVQSGATTLSDLRVFERIKPYGNGYVGLSADALTEEDARALAARAAGEVLDLAKIPAASRKEMAAWLAREIPESHGLAAWALDQGKPIGIDAPDILTASDPQCRWRVFVSWPVATGWENRGWSWVIPADFDEARPFSKWGLAAVRSGNKWGLIDEAGKQVLPLQFDEIGNFSEHGSARVSRDGMVGLVNRHGKVVAEPQWENVQDQIHGFIPVKRDGKWGYLNESGTLVIPCEWDDAWRFSPEGFAVVTRDGKRGIIDRAGKTVVNPEWDGMVNFSKEGLGLVRRGSGWGLVNTTGQILHPPTLDVRWRDRRWDLGFLPHASGFIGRDGKPIDDERTRRYAVLAAPEENFREGLARVDMESGSGFIDSLGEWVIQPKDFFCRDFQNGYAAATKNGKCGLIDRKGALVMDFTWDEVRDVSADRVVVKKDSKWGLCAPGGKIIVPPTWDELRPFRDGMAAVRQGAKWGFMDLDGQVVAAPEWAVVNDFAHGMAAVRIEPTREQLQAVPSYLRGNARSRDGKPWEPGFWTFIDRSGKPALGGKVWFDNRNENGPSFQKGLLSATLVEQGRIRYTTIDREGRFVETNRARSFPGAESPLGLATGLRLDREPRGRYLDRYESFGECLHLADREGKQLVKGFKATQNPFSDHIPYAEPPKYGLFHIGESRIVAQPQWDDIRILSPDRVRVMLHGKYGLVDGMGNTLISPEWDDLEVLSVGSSSIARDGRTLLFGKAKLRARDDRRILSPWVRVRRGQDVRILRDNGQSAIPTSMTNASYLDFFGPEHVVILEKAADGKNIRCLYHPSTGKKIPFPGATRLHYNWSIALHGFIWEQVMQAGQPVWRLLNIKKDIPEHTQPAEQEPLGWGFNDGLALLKKDDGFIFIGLDGKPLTQDRWESAYEFSEGRAAVKRDGKYAFIGTDGKPVTGFIFEGISSFSHGLAGVCQGGLWGYVDMRGNWVINPAYDTPGYFFEWKGVAVDDDLEPPVMTVARVGVDGNTALIDHNGKVILEPLQRDIGERQTVGDNLYNQHATILENGGLQYVLIRRNGRLEVARLNMMRARNGRGWSLVNNDGETLGDRIYDQARSVSQAHPFAGGLIMVYSQRDVSGMPIASQGSIGNHYVYGLRRRDGQVVVEPSFDRIFWIAPGIAAVWNRDGGGLMRTDGTWAFEDGSPIRIARFEVGYDGHPAHNQFRHGLVAVESKPRWGYIRLNRAESR